jgi:hypothetical protein
VWLTWSGVTDRRPRNSELRLRQLEQAEREAAEAEKGILEIFPQDEDEPLARDSERERQPDD